MNISKQANVLAAGVPDEQQLAKINAQAKSKIRAEDVYVFSVRLCDDQPDRDFERFSANALPKLAELFLGKTGIVDHAWSSEKQVARIFDTGVECENGATYIKAWAYILRGEKNGELIREIEAGIRREVSVGCAMAKSICSVCGAEYGTCEHRKGEVYGSELCTAVLCEPTDAYEFSFVAVPAQPKAGVMKKEFEQSAEMKLLREDAALGREYRKELQERVVRLGLMLELGLPEDVLRAMASALEAKQLQKAEQAWKKKTAALYPPVSQLCVKQEKKREEDGAFLV